MDQVTEIERCPFLARLWSVEDIAEWSNYSRSTVAERVVCKPGFPKPIRLEGKGHPRWVPAEVMEWFAAQR